MLEKQLVYFCKISASSKGIVKESEESEFFALKEYIEAKFSLTAIEKFGEIDSQECIVIAFATMKDLQDKKTYLDIVDEKEGLRRILSYKKPNSALEYCPHPIILIGMEDIMQDKSPENKKDDNHNILEKLYLDPCFRFWDSSIWHRYVSLNEDFETNFGNVFEEIRGYLKQGLYTTNVSREFLEFQTRMLVNSYLAPIGKGGKGGHATDVTPYKFHSETAMKEKADKELSKKIKYDEKNLKWRFLLIDDYANAPLRQCSSKDGSKTKQEIIESVLKEKVGNIEICSPDSHGDSKLAVDLVNWALNKLENKMYDIILLDYLLGENTKQNRRELGSEFLEKLNYDLKKEEKNNNLDDKKITKNKGPMGKFWIFPISVFSYAMLDEIHQKGIGHMSDNWYLATGADPVNTPQLFRYNLYRFMNLQITTAPINLNGFMEGSFKSNKVEMTGTDARDCHPEFTTLRSKYDMLNKDKKHNSLFANRVLEKIEEGKPPGVWEHLTHLIYLLAYGSEIEWPEMWEEYNYVKKYFNKDGAEFMDKIRDYIIELKS